MTASLVIGAGQAGTECSGDRPSAGWAIVRGCGGRVRRCFVEITRVIGGIPVRALAAA